MTLTQILQKIRSVFYTKSEVDTSLSSKANASDLTTHTSNTDIHVTTTDKSTWDSKQSALSTDQLNACNSGLSSSDKTKLDGIESGANNYSLPTGAKDVLGGVKTTSTVTSTSGLTASPIINGVVYYKDTNTTYASMSASEATTGTATTARSISAKVLNDKIIEKISGKVNSVNGVNQYSLYSKGVQLRQAGAGEGLNVSMVVYDDVDCTSSNKVFNTLIDSNGTFLPDYAKVNHTHNQYLTAHQDISGLETKANAITGLSVSGKVITYTKGNGTTGTITTQDTNTTYSVASTSANGLMSSADKTKLDGIATGANNYSLPTASSTLGGVKTTSTVTSTSGLTACPIISGVPYYKDTNTTYSTFVKSGSTAAAGLVPKPSTTAGTTKYLREDGTWQVPPDNNTTYSFSNKAATLSWNTAVTIATVGGTDITVKLPANPNTNTTYSAGSNITLSGTTFSLTKANVTGALGYTPVNSSLIASKSQKTVFGYVPFIGSDGVVELGKYIDFHAASDSTVDYDVRLTASSNLLSCSTDFQTGGSLYLGSYKVYVG